VFVTYQVMGQNINHLAGLSGRFNEGFSLRPLQIRKMSSANTLWGCTAHPRRALEAQYRGQPSYCREVYGVENRHAVANLAQLRAQSALGNRAIDMFVAVSASFRLLYVMIILATTAGRLSVWRRDRPRRPLISSQRTLRRRYRNS
jgi:hypothetical protein